jgi:hypothetical protein
MAGDLEMQSEHEDEEESLVKTLAMLARAFVEDGPETSAFEDRVMTPVAILLVSVYPWLQLFFILRPDGNLFVLAWIWLLSAGAFPVVLITAATASFAEYMKGWAWFKFVAGNLGALLVGLSGTLAAFAQTYYLLFGSSAHDFSPALTPIRAAYFTWGVFTTAGSGIVARSPGAQAVAMVQMAVGLVLVFGVLALVGASFRYPIKGSIEERLEELRKRAEKNADIWDPQWPKRPSRPRRDSKADDGA